MKFHKNLSEQFHSIINFKINFSLLRHFNNKLKKTGQNLFNNN
jgi:hypothetical protein